MAMEPIRIECEVDGYTDNWVEVRRRWTKGQQEVLFGTKSDSEFIPLMHNKIVACHIDVYGNDDEVVRTITDIGEITEETLDDIDGVLINFLGEAMAIAFGKARGLDFTNAGQSLNGSEPETETQPTL